MLAMIEYGTIVSLDGASMARNAGSTRSCNAAASIIPKDCAVMIAWQNCLQPSLKSVDSLHDTTHTRADKVGKAV